MITICFTHAQMHAKDISRWWTVIFLFVSVVCLLTLFCRASNECSVEGSYGGCCTCSQSFALCPFDASKLGRWSWKRIKKYFFASPTRTRTCTATNDHAKDIQAGRPEHRGGSPPLRPEVLQLGSEVQGAVRVHAHVHREQYVSRPRAACPLRARANALTVVFISFPLSLSLPLFPQKTSFPFYCNGKSISSFSCDYSANRIFFVVLPLLHFNFIL